MKTAILLVWIISSISLSDSSPIPTSLLLLPRVLTPSLSHLQNNKRMLLWSVYKSPSLNSVFLHYPLPPPPIIQIADVFLWLLLSSSWAYDYPIRQSLSITCALLLKNFVLFFYKKYVFNHFIFFLPSI
uniref:Inositoltrisphosphate 3kinase Blike [Bombyx mori] n=1 Tax=Lepeophtheirus salmonis TaxID=72036 RepID=A0A0K2VAY5_LEPSM